MGLSLGTCPVGQRVKSTKTLFATVLAAVRSRPAAQPKGLLEKKAVSARRRLRRAAAPIAPFGHELIELGLVLGGAQPIEELAELLLLFLEPAQRVGAVVVEGAIAARGRCYADRTTARRRTAAR